MFTLDMFSMILIIRWKWFHIRPRLILLDEHVHVDYIYQECIQKHNKIFRFSFNQFPAQWKNLPRLYRSRAEHSSMYKVLIWASDLIARNVVKSPPTITLQSKIWDAKFVVSKLEKIINYKDCNLSNSI